MPEVGKMPFYPRGCYVAITDRGNVEAVLAEYAEAMLPKLQVTSYKPPIIPMLLLARCLKPACRH